MIATEDVPVRDLATLGIGVVLLAIYVFLALRGRDPLRRGPSPAARFTVLDALGVYGLALLSSMFLSALALKVWPDDVGNRYLLTYLGPVPVAGAGFWLFIRRNPSHGPRAAGALAGVLSWLAWFPVVYAVFAATQLLWEAAGWEWADQKILEDMRSTDAWKFLVAAVICAPLYEETVFRGMLYPALRRALPRSTAIVVTSVFFAAVHFSPAHMPALFVLSLAMTWAYERTGTLAAPIAFHAAFNGWTFVAEMMNAGAS